MKPVTGKVFVRDAKDSAELSKFSVVDNTEARYQITAVGNGVDDYNVGDFVLFTDYKSYRFDGQDIYVVDQNDIVAVKTNSEMKK